MQTRHTLALFLVACQPGPATATGFGSASPVTTMTSTDTGSSSGSGTTTAAEGGSGSGSADTMPEPVRDLGGMPDFGDDAPLGCKGKIDFLFVISRDANMRLRQELLAAAFPEFITTIQSKFADFDHHIMVVTGDDWWGNDLCTELCPIVDCKVGEPCCTWHNPEKVGEPCCDPTYPCQDLDLVTKCDRTWGAGEVFPADVGVANKPCPVDGGRRYLVKGQSDLESTFECIANVGGGGWNSQGQALVAAMQKPINDPGGCNAGFLRKDALLMVTLIATNPDEISDSEGTPAQWAQAVIEAKHGDDKSVVILNIGDVPECKSYDRVCQMAEMFPFRHHVDVLTPYGPGFVEAASLVETACAGFTPPPG